MVAGDGLVAVEAERYSHCCSCWHPGADSAAVYQFARWWHLRDVPSGPDTLTGAPNGRHLGWPAQFFGPLQGYQPTFPTPLRRTLRVPARPWTLALASDLRSLLAVYFLDHRRL